MRFTWLLLSALCAIAIGCGSSGDGTSTFRLRAVHASPDAGNVDIYISGAAEVVLRNVPYGFASDFIDAPSGVYSVAIRAAGAEETSAPVFEERAIDLTGNTSSVTVVAAGLVNGGANDGFRLLKLLHGFDAPGANEAIARIVHAGSDAPTVRIDLGDDGATEAVVGRFADTGAAGVPLPAGAALQVGIRLDDNDNTRVTAFTTPELPAGAELFIIATGLLTSPPRVEDGFALLAVGPDGALGFIRQNPWVYALHAGPNAPPVQVRTGTTVLAEEFGFGQLSTPIQVPPGSYSINLYAPSIQTEALVDTTPALDAGERYLVIAQGFLPMATNELELAYLREQFDIDDTTAIATVVHASPDAPTVELGAVDNGTFTPLGLPDLTYPGTSLITGVDLGVAAFTLGIRVPNANDTAAEFDIAPTPGLRAYAVALGSLFDETAEGFVLALINTATSPWSIGVLPPNTDDE